MISVAKGFFNMTYNYMKHRKGNKVQNIFAITLLLQKAERNKALLRRSEEKMFQGFLQHKFIVAERRAQLAWYNSVGSCQGDPTALSHSEGKGGD